MGTPTMPIEGARKSTPAMVPRLVKSVAIAVVVALMVFVVPELVGIFAHSRRELPLLTRGLIVASDFFRDYGLWLLVGLVALVLVARRASARILS